MYINRAYGLSDLVSTVPTNPAAPYVQLFRGDNFDGASMVLTDNLISLFTQNPDWNVATASMIVNGDWTFLARVARNSKRAANPDVIQQLSSGRYNAAQLQALGIYKRIAEIKLIAPPVMQTAPNNMQAAQAAPAQAVTPMTNATPSAQPATVQFMPSEPTTSLSPASTSPPFGLAFLQNVNWQQWAAIAAVVGTAYTIFSQRKRKSHVAAR